MLKFRFDRRITILMSKHNIHKNQLSPHSVDTFETKRTGYEN